MKNAYRLFAGLLVVTMTALAYADVVTLPTEGAGSIDSATIVAPMSPDTTVWVQNTFGNEIELYSGTTPAVPSGSQGLMIGGTENTAKIKVITNCMQNLGQTTVMNNGTLTVSGSDNTVDYLDNNLTISGGSVLVKKNFYSLRNGANITISDGSLEFLGRFRVGYDSAATVDQTGGTVKLNTISSGDNKYMSIGYKEGAVGVYNMSGGTINTPLDIFIGHNTGAEGTLNMDGGTINSSASVRVGSNGVGTINLFGGDFIQSAGWANLAYEAGSKGYMTVKGGTFTYQSNDFRIGRAGDGVLTLESGKIDLGSKNLVMGYYEGSSGKFTMSGGTLIANGIVLGEKVATDTKPGADGTATFTGVTQTFAGDVNVGSYGTGSLTLNSTKMSNDGTFYVANHTGATGTVKMTNKSSITSKGDITVGRSGTGTLTGDGASLESTTGYIYIGQNETGNGTVTLTNGSSINLPAHTLRVGQAGTGVLKMSDSSYNGPEILIGFAATGDGTFNFDRGTISSKRILVGNAGTGTFNANNADITVREGGFYIGGNESDDKYKGTGTAKLSNTTLNVNGDMGIGNYGTGTLVVDGTTNVSTNGYLYVANHTGSTGTLTLQNGAKVSVPDHTARIGQSGKGEMNVLSGSTFDSSARDIHLGYNAAGDGTLTIDGGTVTSKKVIVGNSGTGKLEVKSGTLNAGTSHIYAGNNAGATGTVNISGGNVKAGDLRVGENGTGEANITGGAITLTYIMYAGLYNKGTINVSGYNTTIAADGSIIVAYDTKSKDDPENKGGRLVISGGTVTTKDDILVANKANSTGTLVVNGGTLTGKDELRVGDAGDGKMTVNGGNVAVSGLANVAYAAGSTGDLSIKNGSVTLTNSGASFRIGRYGEASVEVLEGGNLIVENNSTQLGYYSSGYGTLTVDGGYAKLKKLDIGYASGATGYFEMKDGRVEILAVTDGNEINVGYKGYGYAKISGGEVNLVSLRVGRDSGSFGQLTIEGDGVMNLTSAARICANAGSEGHVYIKDNGQMNVTKELTIGQNAYGTVDVSGGQLNAYPININNGALTVSGGVVRSNQILVANSSSMTLSGGTMNVGDVNVYSGTTAELNGGTLNVGSFVNEGWTSLNGTTINLGNGGIINSTGSFNAASGSVIVNPTNYAYTAGDQILIGRFSESYTADAIKGMTTVPEGWTTAVVDINGYAAVIAQYGSEPTGVKVWNPGTEANMSSASSWSGDTSNNTGFVLGGTNKFKDFSGDLVLVDGTNTFSINAPVPAGHLLVNDGGTTTYGSDTISMKGTLIVNGGTFQTKDGKTLVIAGTEDAPAYVEVNGGNLITTRRLTIGNVASSDKTKPSAKVVINGGNVQVGADSGGLHIGEMETAGTVAELELNGGVLQVNNKRPSYFGSGANSSAKFTQTNGKFTTDGPLYLASGDGAAGTMTISGGIFTTSNTIDVATGANSTGTVEVSGGSFTTTSTLTIGTGTDATGIVNVSGGKLTAKNIKVGRASAGEAAQLNITGGIVEVTSAMYGSDSSPSGNVSISGTGQLLLNSTYSNADYAGIRELSALEIAGAGDGNGARRFLESLDSSVPITLTDDATIGIRAGATFTQRAAINAVPKRSAEQPVLTVTGGGTLKLTESETGSLRNIALDSAQLQMAPDADTAHFGFASVDMSDNSSVVFPAGKTINIGTPDDTEAFTTAVSGTGVFVIDSNLYLDAYTTDRGTGMDKLDFSGFDGNVEFTAPINLTVHLDDASDFLGQVVTLDWLIDAPEELYNIDNINLTLLNDDGVSFMYWLNADGSITFGDSNALPEPSTWALLILGAAGLLYFRKRKQN